MSQAEALLNALSGESTMVYDHNSDVEGMIVIGNDRKIVVPDSLKRLAVQYDHNIETVTFNCPRYWDNHDMSQMKIYITCLLPDNTIDSYLAQNVTVLGNTMTFTWTISGNVTQVKGNISFLVCAKKTNADGNEELHWNSELNTECYISEGLEGVVSVAMKYPDIVTQLLTRMDAVEAIATVEAMQSYTDTWLEANHDRILAEIEAKGVATLATIPEDYTYTYQMADLAARTKGSAVVCSAEGETIVIADSSDDYLRNLNVYGKTTQVQTSGKNLVDIPESMTLNSTKGFTVNLPAGTYIITMASETHSGDQQPYARFYNNDVWIELKNGLAKSVVLTADETTIYIYTYGMSASASDGVTATINQLMVSLTGGDYEPYSGGVASPSPEWPQELNSIENVGVDLFRKNLLNPIAKTNTYKGITLTNNGDGSFTLTGTSTGTVGPTLTDLTNYPIRLYKGKTYTQSVEILSGTKPASAVVVPAVVDSDGNKKFNFLTDNQTKTMDKDYVVYSYTVYLESGVTVDYTFRVQLECNDHATEYSAYDKQSISAVNTLHGIPVTSGGNYTDANGQQWICDEIDFKRGVYIQRILKTVVTDTPQFNETEDYPGRFSWFCLPHEYESGREVCCCNFGRWNTWGFSDGNFDIGAVSGNQMYYSPVNSMTADEVNAKFSTMIANGNPPAVLAQLITPIETPLTAEELTAFANLHSNYPNTTIINDAGAWVKMEYNADTKLYIDNKITSAIDSYLTEHLNG